MFLRCRCLTRIDGRAQSQSLKALTMIDGSRLNSFTQQCDFQSVVLTCVTSPGLEKLRAHSAVRVPTVRVHTDGLGLGAVRVESACGRSAAPFTFGV